MLRLILIVLVPLIGCVALGGGIGAGAAMLFGEKGLLGEYLRMWSAAGMAGGLVVGILISRTLLGRYRWNNRMQ